MVLSPSLAAARLNMTVPYLLALIRKNWYRLALIRKNWYRARRPFGGSNSMAPESSAP
jgi:hypothetical protein